MNINSCVKVKLTEKGFEIYKNIPNLVKMNQKHLFFVAKQTLSTIMFVLEDYTLWDLNRISFE